MGSMDPVTSPVKGEWPSTHSLDHASLMTNFGKLRFRERLVWTVGVTEEKTAFSNSSGGLCWTGL